jgi:uncharacterized protein
MRRQGHCRFQEYAIGQFTDAIDVALLHSNGMPLMHLSEIDSLAQTFRQLLNSLAGWLNRAASEYPATGEILTLRLAPDMYPLTGQIRFACFLALEPLYRLSGIRLPAHLLLVREAGWASHEFSGSLEGAHKLITETIARLAHYNASDFARGLTETLVLELPDGSVLELSGAQYLRDWALPQFYFHVITSYAILRHHGVDLGKRDYLPHMLEHLRPTESE